MEKENIEMNITFNNVSNEQSARPSILQNKKIVINII